MTAVLAQVMGLLNTFLVSFAIVLAATLDREMPHDIPWFLHQGEGAIFAWLWIKDLPISDWEFYQELKKVGVICVPGSTFFPGLTVAWKHKQECLRISLTATESEIVIALKKLAQVTKSVISNQ